MKSPSLKIHSGISNLTIAFLAVAGASLSLPSIGLADPVNNPLIPPTITVTASGPIYADFGDVNQNEKWDKNDPGPLTPSPAMTLVSFTVTYGTGPNDYKSGITYIQTPVGCNVWTDSTKTNPLPTQYQNYSFDPPLSFYLEGLDPTLGPRATTVTLHWVASDGKSSPIAKTIELGDFQADLRVDSLNVGDAPSGSDQEDQVEFSGKSQYPGKIIVENPYFATGLGLTSEPPGTPPHLVPMTIEAKTLSFDPTKATFNLSYTDSIPRLDTDPKRGDIHKNVVGTTTTYSLNKGGIRLWKSNSASHNPANVQDGGDYIPMGMDIPFSTIGSGSKLTVYVEYVDLPLAVVGKTPMTLNVKQTIPAGSDPTVDPMEAVVAPDSVNVYATPVELDSSKADTTAIFLNASGNPSGIGADVNPTYFAQKNPPDPTLSQSKEPALVIFYKDVIDASFNIQPFTVNLNFANVPGATWQQVKGPPNVGSLQNASSASAMFINPNAGGLFQLDGSKGSTTIRTSLILPLAGAEVKDVVSSDMTKADTFATNVLAKYNPFEINLITSNGLRWFYNAGAGDYLGRPDNATSKTCVRFNGVNQSTGMGAVCTWFGVPVRLAKVSNYLVGYACEKIGVWDINAWLSQNLGTKNDASATASFNYGWAVAAGTKTYLTDTVTMLKANFYNSDVKNTRLWPNTAAADNHVSGSAISDFDTQFCSPGFTEMTNP